MIPIKFDECNVCYSAPQDMSEQQVRTIDAYRGRVEGGSCDGADLAIVAWLPTEQELKSLNEGKPIFLSMLYGLAPHFLTTSFKEASHPA